MPEPQLSTSTINTNEHESQEPNSGSNGHLDALLGIDLIHFCVQCQGAARPTQKTINLALIETASTDREPEARGAHAKDNQPSTH
jgi:septal ring-binding cell division protein DamX